MYQIKLFHNYRAILNDCIIMTFLLATDKSGSWMEPMAVIWRHTARDFHFENVMKPLLWFTLYPWYNIDRVCTFIAWLPLSTILTCSGDFRPSPPLWADLNSLYPIKEAVLQRSHGLVKSVVHGQVVLESHRSLSIKTCYRGWLARNYCCIVKKTNFAVCHWEKTDRSFNKILNWSFSWCMSFLIPQGKGGIENRRGFLDGKYWSEAKKEIPQCALQLSNTPFVWFICECRTPVLHCECH